MKEHEKFKRKFWWGSKAKDERPSIPDSKEELMEQITAYQREHGIATLLPLPAAVAVGELESASKAILVYNDERSSGSKRAAKHAQNFLTSFADFLSIYLGFIEPVVGAASVYGSVAFETMSIFFAVRRPFDRCI